jgi:peptidyl-dipeptidase Dcp
MKLKIALTAALCLAIAACSEAPAPDVEEATPEAVAAANPILEDWDTPFGVPPFDRIESEHYLPAFRASMEAHNAEIDAIVANPDVPTFDNTIEALELSGSKLSRVSRIFFAVDGANSDDVTKETAKTIAPELAAHRDNIALNKELFERVLAVYEQRDDLDLSAEKEHLLNETHKQFVRSGANLEDAAQERLREINS